MCSICFDIQFHKQFTQFILFFRFVCLYGLLTNRTASWRLLLCIGTFGYYTFEWLGTKRFLVFTMNIHIQPKMFIPCFRTLTRTTHTDTRTRSISYNLKRIPHKPMCLIRFSDTYFSDLKCSIYCLFLLNISIGLCSVNNKQ